MYEYSQRITGSKVLYSNYGYISYKFNKQIYFKIAKLTYEKFDNEEFQYCIEPFYDVVDAFDNLEIPGFDLSTRRAQYYRSNFTPVFVSERITPKNRVNLHEELKIDNLDYHQPFLLLLDAKRNYSGDKLSLKSDIFYHEMVDFTKETEDIYKTISYILKQLATRSPMQKIGDLLVTSENRAILIRNYIYLYNKISKYYDEKSKESVGRKKKEVSSVVLKEIKKQYENKIINIEEAVKRSGLSSKRTFYRRINELNSSD